MKFFIAITLIVFSLSISASEFQCFSYHDSKQLLANSDNGTIIIKDRFGNELELIINSKITMNILTTTPETFELQFLQLDQVVLHILREVETIKAIYGNDDSFHCRIQ